MALDHSLTHSLNSAHRISMTKLRLGVHTSESDATFINLRDHDRTLYLLRLDNDNTSQIIAKYAHLMLFVFVFLKRRKQFLRQKSNYRMTGLGRLRNLGPRCLGKFFFT